MHLATPPRAGGVALAAGLQKDQLAMHQHHHDENSAPNQADSELPPPEDAHLAEGVPGAQPPLETRGARAKGRELHAAGLTSIYETFHHTLGRAGLGRTVDTLSKLNQKDGFDCPSCA